MEIISRENLFECFGFSVHLQMYQYFNFLCNSYIHCYIISAEPVFTSDTSDKVKEFGKISKAVEIFVNVYSVPKFTIFIWSRGGIPITTNNSVKYDSSSSSTFVNDKIHGKEVQLDGYNLTLTIRDLKAEDFGIYTVTLNSGFADVAHDIVLESISKYAGNE